MKLSLDEADTMQSKAQNDLKIWKFFSPNHTPALVELLSPTPNIQLQPLNIKYVQFYSDLL